MFRFPPLNVPHSFIRMTLLWALAVVVVGPSGEFPLNDDWAYSDVVKGILADGKYRVGDWPAMTLWTHVWLGALVCKLAGGFSYTVLRLVMIVLGLVGVLLFGRLVKRISGKDSVAFLGMIALGFNPLYFSLAHTYMTDISFLFFFLGGLFFYLKAIDSDSNVHWILAIICAISAVLIRQFGLLLPVCFGLAALFRPAGRRRIFWALSGIVLTWAALKGYTLWLASVQPLPVSFGDLGNLAGRFNLWTIQTQFLERMGGFLFLLGLFLLPFHFFALPYSIRRLSVRPAILILSILITISFSMYFAVKTWDDGPLGNILYDFGLGPFALKDFEMGLGQVYTLPAGLWKGIKGLSILGSTVMVFNLISLIINYLNTFSFRVTSMRAFQTGLALFAGGYFVYLNLDWANFDRYYLLLITCLLLLVVPGKEGYFPPWWILAGCLFYTPIIWFSIAGTHDYLAWNRVRWDLLNEAMKHDKIPATLIDGGFEFNASFKTGPANPGTQTAGHLPAGISWWFVADDQYVITTGDLPCYQTRKKADYKSWISGRNEHIFLLERPPFTRIDTFFYDGEQLDTNVHTPVRFGRNHLVESEQAHSGTHAWRLTKDAEFAADSFIEGLSPCDRVTITAWRRDKKPTAGIVAASPDQKEFYAFERYPPIREPQGNNWYRIRLEITLPGNYSPDGLKFYFWNFKQEDVLMDDVQVIIRYAKKPIPSLKYTTQ